jgi:hypothetical protein
MIASRTDRRAREWAEMIVARAQWLDEAECRLLEQVVGQGVRPREIAAVSEVQTRAIQRRVNGLIGRLTDPQVVAVLRCHGEWPAPLGAVALAIWVRKRSYRQTARDLDLTLHQVRRAVEQTKGLLAGVCLQSERQTARRLAQLAQYAAM